MQIETGFNRDFLPAFGFLADASFTGIKSASSATTEPFLGIEVYRKKKAMFKTSLSWLYSFYRYKNSIKFYNFVWVFSPVR